MGQGGVSVPTARTCREPLALAVMAFCTVCGAELASALLVRFIYGFPRPKEGVLELFGILLCTAVAYRAIERGELRQLARRAAGRPGSASGWWCWFSHFKLTLAVACGSLLAAWWLRMEILLWLVEPMLARWNELGGNGPVLHFSAPREQTGAYVRLVLGAMWLVAVPVAASDLWRLLMPLTEPRVDRFRVPFALSSAATSWSVLLLLRQSLGEHFFVLYF